MNEMDNEKRAADWPIKPGLVVVHTSDGEGMSPDVGIELGLSDTASLYIGEVANETLADYGVKVPFAGWWVCLRTATELQPLALTCQSADGNEADTLIAMISAAISKAEDRGKVAGADDAEARAFSEISAQLNSEARICGKDPLSSAKLCGMPIQNVVRAVRSLIISGVLDRSGNINEASILRTGTAPATAKADTDTLAKLLRDLCQEVRRDGIGRNSVLTSFLVRAEALQERGL